MLLTTENVWQEFNVGLKRFILKRIPDEQSADDVLQEVFLKIHTRIDTLREREKLPGWVYQIARNAIYDYYREQKASVALPEMPALPEDPHDDVIAELAPCIRDMVDSLPVPYRQALILTEYEGLSQKALGEQLGLSFSGAKSRVQRARQQIKQMLLDCCHFQFDSAGRIIDYQPKCACCATQACARG
jgi:RNA polymerase sigma-70 factor, ECF subfamily